MYHPNWVCQKCGHTEYTPGEIRVSGGFWSRIFDMQNKKYTAVTCQHCGFTEFYKGTSSTLGNLFDLFTS